MTLHRFKMTLEYDGRPFIGWQKQNCGTSVQSCVEKAILATTGENVIVNAAGRTDSGVHAAGQVAHFDLVDKKTHLSTFRLMEAINAHARPLPVCVRDCRLVTPAFHARFSCTGRSYRYRICNRRAPLTFDHGLAWHVTRDLDEKNMHHAAQYLVGQHDFTTFRSAKCQAASPVKTLHAIKVKREGDNIYIDVFARSFLHHQVRSIVGCLAFIGMGKWTAQDLLAALKARDRSALALNAPANGLTFMSAHYDNDTHLYGPT